MKKAKICALAIVTVLLLAATTATAYTAADPYVVDLLTGQGIDVGDVSVWNDGDYLYVRYVVTDGWYLAETHLQVTDSLAGIPQTTAGSPIPEHFNYVMEHDLSSPVTEYTYPPIDVSGFKVTKLYLAAHAKVVNITTGDMCVFSDNTTTFIGITSGKSGSAVMLTSLPPEWITEVKHPFLDKKARWIWESEPVVHPVEGDIVDFYKTFTITGLYPIEINNTKFFVTSDNGYELYVNDNYVGRAQVEDGWRTSDLTESYVHADGWQSVESYQISKYLKCGSNTYRFATANAHTAGGTVDTSHAGLIFGSKILYTSVAKEETAWGEGSEFPAKDRTTYFEFTLPRPQGELETKQPGFEAIVAIAGLLAVAYMVLRRRS
jgi:PGF-CTERM protein